MKWDIEHKTPFLTIYFYHTIYNPWITEQLINEGAFLRNLFKLCKNTTNDEVHEIYKTLKKNHSIHIKHAKTAYYDSIMLNSIIKSKTAWNIIKSNDHSLVNKMPLSLTDTEGNNNRFKLCYEKF